MQSISKRSHKQTHYRVKQNERKTCQQTKLEITQIQIWLYIICKACNKLSINKIQNINEGQKSKKQMTAHSRLSICFNNLRSIFIFIRQIIYPTERLNY